MRLCLTACVLVALKRSEFGISAGVPPPGSDFGVGDEVEILIEAEFTRPAPARG